MDVKRSITILQPRQQVYQALRGLWAAAAPGGTETSWHAEVVQDDANERVVWRSRADGELRHAGMITFSDAPAGRGTEVLVRLEYDPPAGALGAGLAKIFGEDPASELGTSLRRFKQLLEVGEIVRSDGSLDGAGDGATKERPAQAPAAEVRS